jgi:hypothetical protein
VKLDDVRMDGRIGWLLEMGRSGDAEIVVRCVAFDCWAMIESVGTFSLVFIALSILDDSTRHASTTKFRARRRKRQHTTESTILNIQDTLSY